MRTAHRPEAADAGTSPARAGAAVAAAALLVAVAAVWGAALDGIVLPAPPLFAKVRSALGPRALLPAAVAALVIWKGPALARRLPWRALLPASALAAAAWGATLALVDSAPADGLTRGIAGPSDYLRVAERIAAPGPFLDTFVERIGEYTVHVRGHPPGLVLALWWLGRAGLGGPAPLAAIVVAAGALVVPAVLVAAREVSEPTARRAAPFLALSPAAIWLVSSADALFALLGAAGTAAVVVAVHRRGPRADAAAVAGGVVLACGLFASYGLVPLLAIPAAVVLAGRRWRVAALATTGALAVGAAFAAHGFAWPQGLAATRTEYAASVAAVRPYAYFVVANLAAFAIVLGPAAIAGLATLRERGVWILTGASLVAVVAADLSGLSKGEVERIWLPFWPWVALASGAIVISRRWWLAAQAAVAIAVQVSLRTPW